MHHYLFYGNLCILYIICIIFIKKHKYANDAILCVYYEKPMQNMQNDHALFEHNRNLCFVRVVFVITGLKANLVMVNENVALNVTKNKWAVISCV